MRKELSGIASYVRELQLDRKDADDSSLLAAYHSAATRLEQLSDRHPAATKQAAFVALADQIHRESQTLTERIALSQQRTRARQVQSQMEAAKVTTYHRAARFLIDSEELVWTLQGSALREAAHVLQSNEAEQIVTDAHRTALEREKRLRAYLYRSRSENCKGLAQQLIGHCDQSSVEFLTDAARRDMITTEQYVLDWITYEAIQDFALFQGLWAQRGAFRENLQYLLESFFANLDSSPDIDSGVQVIAKTDHTIYINVYGALVYEEVLFDDIEVLPNEVAVRWKSNYDSLRSIFAGEPYDEVLSEVLERKGLSFGLNYFPYFREYALKGNAVLWATYLSSEDVVYVAKLVEEFAAVPSSSRVGNVRSSRAGLRNLFNQLSPAVAQVESVGRSTGSGCLIAYKEDVFVATNRHVIENAPNGYRVRFYVEDDADTALTISRSCDHVVKVHRSWDLALISLTDYASVLEAKGIVPLSLGEPRNEPVPGDYVFVIGHPGTGEGSVLARTLADGIVSAVRTVEGRGPCIQTTVPINPGNSGGPLFDEYGNVIGIATFIYRRGQGGMALEGLNFALSVSALQDLLNTARVSLSQSEIARIVVPVRDDDVGRAVAGMWSELAQQIVRKGYKAYAGTIEKSTRVFGVAMDDSAAFSISGVRGGEYVALGVSPEGIDIDIVIMDPEGNIVGSDWEGDSCPIVTIRAFISGTYSIVVVNNSRTRVAPVIMTVFER